MQTFNFLPCWISNSTVPGGTNSERGKSHTVWPGPARLAAPHLASWDQWVKSHTPGFERLVTPLNETRTECRNQCVHEGMLVVQIHAFVFCWNVARYHWCIWCMALPTARATVLGHSLKMKLDLPDWAWRERRTNTGICLWSKWFLRLKR